MTESNHDHTEYIRELKHKRKDWLYNKLEEMGEIYCPDCGEKIEKDDLCFHHPRPENKKYKILGYCLSYSKESILDETAKARPMHIGCHTRRGNLIAADNADQLEKYPLDPLGTAVTGLN